MLKLFNVVKRDSKGSIISIDNQLINTNSIYRIIRSSKNNSFSLMSVDFSDLQIEVEGSISDIRNSLLSTSSTIWGVV